MGVWWVRKGSVNVSKQSYSVLALDGEDSETCLDNSEALKKKEKKKMMILKGKNRWRDKAEECFFTHSCSL